MFFSVASPDWKPGQRLTPAGALLFRTRSEAASFTPDAVVVVVSVRYDAAAQAVWPQSHGQSGGGTWSARAVGNRFGGITVFDVIPADLVRPCPADRAMIEGTSRAEPVAAGFHGWDSLTMALLA